MPTDPPVPTSPRVRLFVALWPAAAVRAQLQRIQAAWHWPPGAALTPAERLHLTVHFIGEVEQDSVPKLSRALAGVAVEPVELVLDTAEVWSGGVAVLRANPVPASLQRLHMAVRDTVERVLDVPGEHRRFKPHVTLARKAGGARAPLDHAALPWRVEGFALEESLRGATTAYRCLSRVVARTA